MESATEAAPASSAPQAVPTDAAVSPPERASLFVCDLDKSVDEKRLYEVFSSVGRVHSVRVRRDPSSRQSMGSAYVNYDARVDPDAAKNAIEKLNYEVVNGKPIRIMRANAINAVRAQNKGNVFVKNLEKNITSRQLADTFGEFGEVLSCKVATDDDGQSKGFGFVQFANPEDAKDAIAKVNGMVLGEQSNKVVTVTEFLPRHERGDVGTRFTNLYIKNLPTSIGDEDALRKLFEEFGEISSVAIFMDVKLQKKFGFVNFERAEAAVEAQNKLHNHTIDGCSLFVDRAQSKSEREGLLQRKHESRRKEQQQERQGRNVYVKHIPEGMDETQLQTLFQEYGEIDNVKIMRDAETKKPRGFGFVCFGEPGAAQAAVVGMRNRTVGGNQLYVAHALSKAEREIQVAVAAQAPAVQRLSSPVAPHVAHLEGYPAMLQHGAIGMYPDGLHHFPPAHMNGSALHPAVTPGAAAMWHGGAGQVPMNPGMPFPGASIMHMPPGAGVMAQHVPFAGRGGRGARRGPGGGYGGRGGRGGGRPHMAGRHSMQAGKDPRHMVANQQERPVQPMPRAQAPEPASAEEMLTSRLQSMSLNEQRQHLGELLFPKVSEMLCEQRYPAATADKLAAKITGMFLEMDTTGLLLMLDTDEGCREAVQEALDILRQHHALPEGCV